mmetsp:Transcript_25325/g.76053  ORF Transcript_25325/g.76053 Transcript_25325/m.76053 type:complete len:112 (+) Transcript_25325:175-510(+)
MWQIRAAGLLGASSVGLGAVGAHALKCENEYREIWFRANHYHQIHALALLGTAFVPSARARAVGGAAMLAGTALFAGSNYVVAYHQDRTYGKLAPYGGTALIGGWFALAVL